VSRLRGQKGGIVGNLWGEFQKGKWAGGRPHLKRTKQKKRRTHRQKRLKKRKSVVGEGLEKSSLFFQATKKNGGRGGRNTMLHLKKGGGEKKGNIADKRSSGRRVEFKKTFFPKAPAAYRSMRLRGEGQSGNEKAGRKNKAKTVQT